MIPTIPGVPSWGAVLIAVTFTAIGFAFDAGSGDKELGLAFAAAYVIGCVAAVVAVRQTGVFTAVIQPPLLLFVSVPGAYFLFHSGATDGLKDLLINCGYPLIERFPLMFFTSAIVLLIGLLRWYLGMGGRRTATAEATESESRGPFAAVTAKISSVLSRDAGDGDADDAATPPRRSRQHSIDRSARTARASKTSGTSKSATAASRTRSGRPVKRTQPSRSRHTRPPETEIIEPVVERPRRPRTTTRRSTEPPVPPPEPRRRTRSSSSSTREPRKQPPASERRSRYQRPDRHSRFDGFEPFEPHGTNGSNGNGSLNGTHHPVSRVRYRGADDGEQRAQYRSQPRPSKHSAEAWEYDV
ncbi:MAG: DUF6542 domain-containing protein [Mycobacterium sp.]